MKTWNQGHPISMTAVEALYHPRAHYMVQGANYPAGARFSGSLLTGADVYVLSGQIRYSQGTESAALNAGEGLVLAKGLYEAEVTGVDIADLIMVYPLPEALWPGEN